MDKSVFIKWLLDCFKVSDFSYENQASKLKNGLLDNINFARIADYIKLNKISVMPTSIEINRIARDNNYFINEAAKNEALRHIEEIRNTPKMSMHDLPEGLKIKIINMCHKIGAKTVLEEC